jgi:L-2-hydroxycarboxylate dehydrogenase (NAD+)
MPGINMPDVVMSIDIPGVAGISAVGIAIPDIGASACEPPGDTSGNCQVGGKAVTDDLTVSVSQPERVSSTRLRDFIARCYVALGVGKTDAEQAANILVAADLLGKDTHGVQLFPSSYFEALKTGRVNPRPEMTVVRETSTTALFDGDNRAGAIVGRFGMNLAIQKATEHSVGLVTVRNSRHFAAAGVYAMMALDHGMIGLAMTNATPAVVPTFGLEPRMGTNPIAVAVPAGREQCWVLDMATSVVATNKLTVAARLGRSIPEGWITDRQGNPVTDPNTPRNQRLVVPLGSTPTASSYKGYGLGVWVDIMCGVLSGNGFGQRLPDGKVGHFFGAIAVEAFLPLPQFKAMMDVLLEDLNNTPPMPGAERVYYAGERERATEVDRRANGIPLYPELAAELRAMAAELGVEYDL